MNVRQSGWLAFSLPSLILVRVIGVRPMITLGLLLSAITAPALTLNFGSVYLWCIRFIDGAILSIVLPSIGLSHFCYPLTPSGSILISWSPIDSQLLYLVILFMFIPVSVDVIITPSP